MRIIGVDPGLNVTGIGIIAADGDNIAYVAHNVVRTSTEQPLVERLSRIQAGVGQAIREWLPGEGAVESPFVSKNARSALLLGHARAAALLAMAAAGLAVAEYPPAAVKQSVAGYGRGDKEQVARMVAFQLGLTQLPGPADVSDALAVAITHWARSRLAQRL